MAEKVKILYPIIGFSGKAGSGKDEAAKQLNLISDKSFVILKFADAIKEAVANIIDCDIADLENNDFKNKPLSDEWDTFKITDGQTVKIVDTIEEVNEFKANTSANVVVIETIKMTPRLMMQKFGTEAGRAVHKNIWVNATLALLKYYSPAVITDVRFPNEIEAIERLGGIVVRLEGREHPGIPQHASETALDNYNFDIRINNGDISLKGLQHEIRVLLS